MKSFKAKGTSPKYIRYTLAEKGKDLAGKENISKRIREENKLFLRGITL